MSCVLCKYGRDDRERLIAEEVPAADWGCELLEEDSSVSELVKGILTALVQSQAEAGNCMFYHPLLPGGGPEGYISDDASGRAIIAEAKRQGIPVRE